MRLFRVAPFVLAACAQAYGAGRVFEVGPEEKYVSIRRVPWDKLKAGDEVRIHWRPEPYREKWVIAARGKADAHIAVKGVPNEKGELPVIDGDGAIAPTSMLYDNEDRGVITISPAEVPLVEHPAFIDLENLEILNARARVPFTNAKGLRANYEYNAASVHISLSSNITVRDCIIHDSGNGIFVTYSQDIHIEGNHIYGNGYAGDSQFHNVYSEALRIVYERNWFGPVKGSEKGDGQGNNLKDRSAGLIVRYNWIEDGNRQLDLVESPNDGINSRPAYQKTFVYGNVLIDHAGNDNNQMVNYGGDGGKKDFYRRGTLYFYNNTLVSFRSDMATMFLVSHPDGTIDARNNVFYAPDPAASLFVSQRFGTVILANNWIREKYTAFAETVPGNGVVKDSGGNILGPDPGFLDLKEMALTPTPGAPLLGAAGALAQDANELKIAFQYEPHRKMIPRDHYKDIGAFGNNSIGGNSR